MVRNPRSVADLRSTGLAEYPRHQNADLVWPKRSDQSYTSLTTLKLAISQKGDRAPLKPMELDAQVDLLVRNAEDHGLTPLAITTIAPVLLAVAGQLRHAQYYVLQTLEQGWVMTTLNNRNQPDRQKNVVYVYPTLKDAADSPGAGLDPRVMALPIPVIHILFQLLAMKPVDSLIFYETTGQNEPGMEVRRHDLESLIQSQLQGIQSGDVTPPPNLA